MANPPVLLQFLKCFMIYRGPSTGWVVSAPDIRLSFDTLFDSWNYVQLLTASLYPGYKCYMCGVDGVVDVIEIKDEEHLVLLLLQEKTTQ